MITLTANINVIDYLSEPKTATINYGGNNISNEIVNVLNKKKQAKNPFIIGASKIGGGETLSRKVDYFIGKALSHNDGNFRNSYIIEITGEQIKTLTIIFDNQNNRYPPYITIDNVKYSNDYNIFTVANLNQQDTHTIKISSWSVPYHPIVITAIYAGIDIKIDKMNLISLSANISYRSDNKLPSYGIISNTGNIDFKDISGEVREYAEKTLLTSGLKAKISLNNTLDKTEEQVADFETKEWDYDNDTRVVSVSLKDGLEEWQDINVKGFDADLRVQGLISMKQYYLYLYDNTPTKDKMISFENLELYSKETYDIILNTYVKRFFMEDGSLWQQWQKLCEVCGLYIYKNNKGETICTNNWG